MSLLFSNRVAELPKLFGEEVFIRFTERVYHESLSIYVCAYFPMVRRVGMWNLFLIIAYLLYLYHTPLPVFACTHNSVCACLFHI